MNSIARLKNNGRIRILIVAGTDPVGDWMANVITGESGMSFLGVTRDLSQALDAVEEKKPDVILLDIDSGVLRHGDLVNRLAASAPKPAIIIVAMMGEVETVQQAMLYGAQGFLLKPFSQDELLKSIQRAYDLTVQRRAELSEPPFLSAGLEMKPKPEAEIIAVFSPKGGVGCTTVAVNLAIALKTITNKPVTLMDGDLRFGDIDTALNINTTTSISTLLPHLDELDNQSLDQALVSHNSGIKVLIAPPYIASADRIEPEQLDELLMRLTKLNDGYVVIDAWSTLDDCTLSFVDACHQLVLVTTPQVTALRDMHRFLDVLKLLQYDSRKTTLVINQCYQYSNLNVKDVERALGHPIAQVIDYAPKEVTNSLNRGVPLLQGYQDSKAAQSIVRLAQQLVDHEVHEERPNLEITPTSQKGRKTRRRGLFSRGAPTTPSRVKS
jgi:pilus assembly protein CpaE